MPVAHRLPLPLSADLALPSCWLPSLPWLLVKRSPLPCRTRGGTSGSSVSLLMLLATRVLWCRDSFSSSTSREGITWRQVRAGAFHPHPASLWALCTLFSADRSFPTCLARPEVSCSQSCIPELSRCYPETNFSEAPAPADVEASKEGGVTSQAGAASGAKAVANSGSVFSCPVQAEAFASLSSNHACSALR